jgi:hypothetical protein
MTWTLNTLLLELTQILNHETSLLWIQNRNWNHEKNYEKQGQKFWVENLIFLQKMISRLNSTIKC